MIRVFKNLCKAVLKSITDEAIFWNVTYSFRFHDKKCPRCGAYGKLYPYGDYPRFFVFLRDGKTVSRRIRPFRFKCASCKATHALLPYIIIPYSPYSLGFILTVLVAYFERETTVAEICGRFGIAVSTLYAFKKRLAAHKQLLIGIFLSMKKPALAFLRGIISSESISAILGKFFRRYSFSFLQNRTDAVVQSIPP